MARGCQRSELWQTTVVFYVRGKNMILFFCMPKGSLQVVSTSSLHPAFQELVTPGDTEKGPSPCERAACAVFLGWSSALGTRGFADLAVAVLIDVFSWGTKSSCLSDFYMRAARSLCGCEKNSGDSSERRDLEWLSNQS